METSFNAFSARALSFHAERTFFGGVRVYCTKVLRISKLFLKCALFQIRLRIVFKSTCRYWTYLVNGWSDYSLRLPLLGWQENEWNANGIKNPVRCTTYEWVFCKSGRFIHLCVCNYHLWVRVIQKMIRATLISEDRN